MPFTDNHQLNLDWILKSMKDVLDQIKYYFVEGGNLEALEDAIAEHPELNIENPYVTPEMFGAVGDGNTNDTEAIQRMFNETTDEVLYFDKKYRVNGTIVSERPRNMIGNTESHIIASTSTPILQFNGLNTENTDFRNYYIKNLNVIQNGSGHAVAFENYSDRISSMLIENCKFYAAYNSTTGYGLYCLNSLAHSLIVNCQFRGNGAYMNCRDSNLIEKCLFWGRGNGIVLKPAVYGCLNNAIKDNTIVNTVGNSIQVIDGEQVLIENNQIEYANSTDAQTATNRGLIVLISEDDNRRCEHVVITDNNFGGSTAITNQIIVDDAQDTYINNNRFVNLAGSNIRITENSKRTTVKPNNYRTSNAGVISNLIVTADGEILEFPFQVANTGVTTLTLVKKRNGYVTLRYYNLQRAVNQIATLPSWAVNSGYQVKLPAVSPNNELYTVYISPTGIVSLSAPGGAPTVQTGLYYPAGEYYAGFAY